MDLGKDKDLVMVLARLAGGCLDRYARVFYLEALKLVAETSLAASQQLVMLLMPERWCPLTTVQSPY